MASLRRSALLSLSLCCAPALVSAQPFATLSWQLQPYCNRVTLTINQDGGVFTLDGYDDQCGAAQRAPIVGTAVQNPDGTIGLGFTAIVTGARAVHVNARVNPGNGSGTWLDSAGNSGALALNAAGGGAPRPAPAAGPAWGTVIQRPDGAGSADGLRVVVPASVSSSGSALVGQLGEAPPAMPSSPAGMVGASRYGVGVLGSSGDSAGVAGTSIDSYGVAGESTNSVGVFGLSFGGPGVRAVNGLVGTGVALEINNGALQVAGDLTPAFVVTATVGNTAGHITTVDHPLLNDTPNALVFVTRVWGSGSSTVNILSPLAVFYTGTRWTIFREDGAAMPINTRFNVLVVSR